MLLKSFIASSVLASSVLATGLTLSASGALAEQPVVKKPDIAEMLKRKMLKRKPIRRYGRQIYGSARLTREVKADLVVLSVGIKADGENAGKAVSALDAKKKSILDAIKSSGFDVASGEVSALRVYNRNRSKYVNGQRTNVGTFQGSMSIEFTFKAGENVLADVAKIAGDRVTNINSMRYKFSKQAWDVAATELKAEAFEKATQNAKQKAEQRNATLGTLMTKTVNDPYRRSQRGLRKRTMQMRVNARVTYQSQ